MANIWEKAYSILTANLNSDLSYLITNVLIQVGTQTLSIFEDVTAHPVSAFWRGPS